MGAAILRAAMQSQPVDAKEIARIMAACKVVFPIKARDLMPHYSGKALGVKLATLEARWIASGFVLSREDLMTEI